MKILHVIASASPAGGGPIQAIRQAAKTLQRDSHRNDIACLDGPGAWWLDEMPSRVHALGPGLLRYGYARGLKRWLATSARSYDCVISHGLWDYTSLATWRALRKGPVPYFVYPHGMLDPRLKRTFPFRHVKKVAYWLLLQKRVLRDARAVFFTCEAERDLAGASFGPPGGETEIVPYCVGAPPDEDEASPAAFLRRFPRLQGKRIVLFLGRIHPKKGCDLLIRAFAGVAAQDPSLELVVAGPDGAGWQRRLSGLATRLGVDQRVTWTGMLLEGSKWAALRAAEVFVLPTYQENYGIALVEALGCGTPVLTTDRVNIWQAIQSDGAGLIGTPDPEGVADVLRRWLATPGAERAEMGARARDCYARRFRSEDAGKRLIEALRSHGVGG